jgi:hypothetical protein
VHDGSNQHVVALFPGALGDFVLVADALASLRARHAGAPMVLAVNGWLRDVAVASGVADETACLDDAAVVGLFGGTRLPEWFGVRPHLHAWLGGRDPMVQEGLRRLTESAAFHPVVRDDGFEHASRVYARQLGLDPASVPATRVPARGSVFPLCELMRSRIG